MRSNGSRRRRRRRRSASSPLARPLPVRVPGLVASFAAAVAVVAVAAVCIPLYAARPGASPGGEPQSLRALAQQVGEAAAATATASASATPVPAATTPTGEPTVVPTVPAPALPPAAAQPPALATSAGNPFAGGEFYDSPDTEADRVVAAMRQSRPADAAVLAKISDTPAAYWVGDWLATGQVRGAVAGYVGAAHTAGAIPVVVVYAIPHRDCGGYSAGGLGSPEAYRSWVAEVAAGLGGGGAAVVLEPDAIPHVDCLSPADAATRYSMLRDAAAALTSAGGTVYIDAGNSGWLSAAEAANRLRQAGVVAVRGFALNISNYRTTSDSLTYGAEVSRLLGGSRFVIDTSRNGLGPASNGEWCNPAGRALGAHPTVATGNAFADALLWLKGPGESDGTCNGGPPAGQFWLDYALGLASRANW